MRTEHLTDAMRGPAEHLSEAVRGQAERVADVVRSASAHVPTQLIEDRLPGRKRRRRSAPPVVLIVLAVVAAAVALLAVRRTRGHEAESRTASDAPRTDPERMETAVPGTDPGVLGMDVNDTGDVRGHAQPGAV